MQRKWIQTFKQNHQKPNDTAQTLKPYFRSNNTVHSPVTITIRNTRVWRHTKYVEPWPCQVIQTAST